MSYTPTTWSAGDTITAAKLNKIEQGIVDGGGAFLVTLTSAYDSNLDQEVLTANKTAGEVNAAFLGGKSVIFYYNGSYGDDILLVYVPLLGYEYREVQQEAEPTKEKMQDNSYTSYNGYTYHTDSTTLYAASDNDYLTSEPPSSNDTGR